MLPLINYFYIIDLWDKTTVKSIHNVVIEKDKFQIFDIPIKYI